MSRLVAFTLLLVLAGCASALPTIPSVGMTFEDFGCAGDWPSNEPQKTTVVRTDAEGTTSFEVRHPASCGLSARQPGFSIAGDVLAMRYELYSPNNMAIMCDCAYRSKFKFTHLPPTIKSATFAWSEHER